MTEPSNVACHSGFLCGKQECERALSAVGNVDKNVACDFVSTILWNKSDIIFVSYQPENKERVCRHDCFPLEMASMDYYNCWSVWYYRYVFH